MKLQFLYWPTDDLAAADRFHRDELGLTEAWRDGDDTIAFQLPGDTDVQVMVSTTTQPAGPMYLVDDVGAWLAAHPAIAVGVDRYDIPGGTVVGLTGPDGYPFYVYDQR